MREKAESLQRQITSDTADVRILEKARADLTKWSTERGSLTEELGEAKNNLQTLREAVAVLGRNGAQQEIAQV
ncbi:MAG: hypothetical protein GY847_21850 [Proteobacteria bacterium]|nr:hypothetical protein [Pseudomonadota bacterium]